MQLSLDRHNEKKKSAGGKAAVLFVHGIQGSPCQFQFLLDALPHDISFHNLLLPGHGDDFRAFRKSGMLQWQEAVNSAAAELRKRYKKVYFVGHSMGCLLGLNACMQKGIAFDGIFLLACPLKLRFSMRYFTHNHLTLFVNNSKNLFMQASVEANSISAKYPWQYFSCLHPYMQLLKLIKKTRAIMKRPSCNLIAVHMEKDEIVSKKSLDMLVVQGGAKTKVYPGCGHNYFREEAKEDMIFTLKKMLDA